jgi:hypothetical protein
MSRAHGLTTLLLLLCVQGASSAPCAAADAFVVRSYPLPISVDVGTPAPCTTCDTTQMLPETKVRSSLFLRFEERDVRAPFLAFAARPLSDRERLFVATVQAIHRRDYKAFAAVWGSNPPADAGFSMSYNGSPLGSGLRGILNTYAIFGGLSTLKTIQVESEIRAGSALILVYRAQAQGPLGPFQSDGLFDVYPNAAGRLKITDGADTDPADLVDRLLSDIIEQRGHDPATYTPVQGLRTAYRYAIPLKGGRDSATHPVSLQFSGTSLDYAVADEPGAAANPVLKALRRDYLALERGDIASFAAACTPGIRLGVRNYRQIFQSADQTHALERESTYYYGVWNDGSSTFQPATYPKNIRYRFMIDADPVYVLFYSAPPGSGATSLHRYVYRDSAGNYLLANNFTYLILDDLLRAPSFFRTSL